MAQHLDKALYASSSFRGVVAPVHTVLGQRSRCRRALTTTRAHLGTGPRPGTGCCSRSGRFLCQAYEQGNHGSSNDSLENFVEVKVDQVKSNGVNAIVYLRILDGRGDRRFLPVHIGENESNALQKELNKQRQLRPLTHDLMRNLLREIKFRVTKIVINDIVSNTYYARVHLAQFNDVTGLPEPGTDVNVDARPSDAINLAIRFGARMYVSKRIVDAAAHEDMEPPPSSTSGESSSEIVRSVRETLANYEDPTVMYTLQKALAVKEERFKDAAEIQQRIFHEMVHNQALRLVVAMETALSDGRYEEAARLRDEFKRLTASNAPSEQRRM